MQTEVWFRNPHDYVRELVETGETKIAWDRGLLLKKGIDPIRHAGIYFSDAYPWRLLTIGTQGSAEYRPGCTIDKPVAVYPTWEYGESSIVLEEMVSDPIGEHRESCEDMEVRPDERPVWGQEHRVIITGVPDLKTGAGKSFIRYLKGLQQDHPDCIIHLHGLYSYKVAFGMGFRAADVDPRTPAQKGNVHTPAGSTVKYERVVAKPQWAAAMGMQPSDLEVPRNRCIYNIKSAVWAGAYYNELFAMRTRRSKDDEIDYESSDNDFKPLETKSPLPSGAKAQEGDKFICNTCTLQNKCKYFREGSVCTVPGAEPVQLSAMFGSRNVDDIMEGLGVLVQANTHRLQKGINNENELDELDPEVSKIMGQVFDQASKLAKMHDPLRFAPPKGAGVTVNVGNGSASLSATNPRQLASQVIQGFVNQGIPRDQITPAMIKGALEGLSDPDAQQKAIAGTVLATQEESR